MTATASGVDDTTQSNGALPPPPPSASDDGAPNRRHTMSSAITTTTTTNAHHHVVVAAAAAAIVGVDGIEPNSQPENEPSLPANGRPRSQQRMLSESDATDVMSGVFKQKRQRRRRGKGRWKPYHDMTTEEKLAKDERVERNALRKRARLFSNGKPMAPYNTTQFLVEDREKRLTTADSDGDSINGASAMPPNSNNISAAGSRFSGGGSPQRERIRLLSGSDAGGNSSESASLSGEEDELLEREFEAEYDSVNLMRISGMSREEITREMMYLERNNGKLADRISILQLENESLKKLLEDNNIDYENVLSAKRRRSGDSFESDVSAVLDGGLIAATTPLQQQQQQQTEATMAAII